MESCKTCKYRNCVAIRCVDCACQLPRDGIISIYCGCLKTKLCINYEYVKRYVVICVDINGISHRDGEHTFLWQAKRAAHTIGKYNVGMIRKIYIFDTRTNNRIGVEI